MITDEQQRLLQSGIFRHALIEEHHRAGTAEAKKLHGLIGLRCKKLGHEYTITRIEYGWDGYIVAHGKKWLTTGKESRYPHNIGPITPKAFE